MKNLPIGTTIFYQVSPDDLVVYGEITEVTRRGYIVRSSEGSHEITPGMVLRVTGES